MTNVDYAALFAKADADLKDANARYSQAAADSMDAAFRGLVFGCAAHDVTTIKLEPSDQGDYMSIVWLLGPDGDDHEDSDDLSDDLWNFASDLTDYTDAPWRILPGITVPDVGYTVEIDVKVAAEGLVGLAGEAAPEQLTRRDDMVGKTIASIEEGSETYLDTYKDEVTVEQTYITFTDGTKATFGEVSMDLYTTD